MDKILDNEEAIKRWNTFAEEMGRSYADDGDLNRRYLLNPVLFEMIGEVKGKKVLDAGCGEGYLSRMIANQGGEVVGIDYSEKMIEVAKKKTPEDIGIQFYHGNYEEMTLFNDNSFDIVISNMVIHDLAQHKKAFEETYRVLNNEGLFVFSILHPCFDTPSSGWVRNDKGEKIYWKVEKYFAEGPNEQSSTSENKLLWFHRTLSSYVNSLRKAGFIIDSIEEPKPSQHAIEQHRDFQSFLNMCQFLIFKVIKMKDFKK